MKVADEPAYLTVGTDVSAKYRGAFCEAKIKTVKRMVKVKVMLKGDSTSQVVQDDQVKGPLRVGSTVEVRSPEGGLSEAVISKLTDASWYTVVFDDGDEKTLRRTSLCLKGERHFAESETLDQLPLTNPEHFGTPVIGKKTNRGRRSSQAVAEDEKESSSSEDDDDDRRRLNDDLLGKVAYIESGSDSNSWFCALVISPSCNDDITIKKDQCLVRSFADSKFHTVARKDIHEVKINTISKPEYSNRKGFEAAQLFQESKQIPDSWKMDLSEILESSSSDEEEGEEVDDEDGEGEGKESEEEEKRPVQEEPDDEPDPEERDHFLQQLYKFMEDRGTPINKPPVLGYKDLNLFKLFRLVHHHGGCDNIESGSIWKQIYMDLGIPVLNSAASYNVKTAYRKYLYGFEEYCRSAQIQFRTVHHNEPRPDRLPEVKSDQPVKNESEEEEEEEVVQPIKAESEDGDESDAESEKGLKDICSPRGRRRCTLTPVKVEGRDPLKVKEEKKKEETPKGGEGSGEEPKEKADGEYPGKRRSRRLEESDKESDDEDLEDDEDEDDDVERPALVDRDDREDGDGCEDSEHSLAGTKVKVKYGKGKTQKIYEANIKSTETDNGEILYLVHYYGWNVRYDEWVKADRIIWPVDKGGTKKKQKKKVKNKEDGEKEKDDDKQVKVPRRGRPPLKSTPPNTSGSGSKTPTSEGRSSSKNSRSTDGSVLPNGEGTPRRRTRTTSGMYDDSDRGSNDSGNSSDDSECEDSPEKKPEWTERIDPPPTENEEVEDEPQEDESRLSEPTQDEPECPNSPDEMPDFQDTDKPEEDTTLIPESDDGSPKSRVNKPQPREAESETPTQTPATANHSETEEPCTPPRPAKKSQETPHSSPEESIPDTAGSDTDSATEDVWPSERIGAVKRKTAEQRTPEKKIRLDRKEEPNMLSPVKTPPLEKSSEVERRPEPIQKPEEHPTPTLSSPSKDLEVKSEMPALTREVHIRLEPLCSEMDDPTIATNEEMMPQIGPEALVCHEVDLDDPEEKDKPSGEELLMMMKEEKVKLQPLEPSEHLPHAMVPVGPPRLFSPSSTPSPDESHSTKSESDATIEVDSVAESQEGLGENESTHSFDASASSSNSSISLQDRDAKDRGQKRLLDCTTGSLSKKQKRSQKHSSVVCKTENNGAGLSSDSEDPSAMDSSNKLTPVKHSSLPKSQKLSRSPALVSPNSKDMEKDKHKEKPSVPSPRAYKWSCQLTDLDNMSSTERISFLQEKLQEIRKYYMSLKSEVASIDRRRKRLKKKEREVSHTTASTSSGSSDTGMSPSSASPTQNTVAVECR